MDQSAKKYETALTDTAVRRDAILGRCRELGFALGGICRAERTEFERELRDWLAATKHGEMEYLRRNVELRIDPRALLADAKSFICVADRYDGQTSKGQHVKTSKQRADEAFGRIARYARGDDYHVVMTRRLRVLCDELASMFPNEIFRACVDTAPVLEREHAQRAGLGAVGKNTLLIERGVGSYLLLGQIITTLALEPSMKVSDTFLDPCGTCTRCIDACPTQAITPWSVDATKCISYLTIEHRGLIDEKYHQAMGDWIFGCDICQEVCPHNQPTARSQQAKPHPAYAPRLEGFDLLEVLNWDEVARRKPFIKSAMKRAKLNMMKRNALIAAGNAPAYQRAPILLARIAQIAEDQSEDAMLRTTASTVIKRIGGS